MNSKIYLQYDSRWGNLPYPSKYSTVATDGCGLLSVTHCAIELYKYRDKTPVYFHPFMKKWAAEGNGTYRNGITAGLKEYLGNCITHDTMKSLWEELSKGDRVGVIYFGGNSYGPDGTLWTLGGHYQAFVDYKVKNKKHWLYMKDSGSRQHSGWYCYEDSMKGCIPDIVWSAVKTGWQKDSDWYYLDSNGKRVVNNWVKDDIGWCYLGEKGYMFKSKWIKDKGNWYYLGSNGYMVTKKWVKDSKGWCYLEANGKMAKSKWIKWKNLWYYIRSDGHMAENAWIKYKNEWYYVKKNGAMVTGTYTIDGKKHKFDSSGKWLGEVKG